MLMDLSDLQRADRERRLHVVANIPVSIFNGIVCYNIIITVIVSAAFSGLS